MLGRAGDPCEVPGCGSTEGTRLYVAGRVLCVPHSPSGRPAAGAPVEPLPPVSRPIAPVPVSPGGPPLSELAAANVARALGAASRAPRTVADPYVREGRTVTSFAAARKALPKSGTQRARVLDAIVEAHARGYGGACDLELIKHLKLAGNSVRPRRGELVEMGLVEDSGRTRRREGADHTVWRPTRAALAALHRLPDGPA